MTLETELSALMPGVNLTIDRPTDNIFERNIGWFDATSVKRIGAIATTSHQHVKLADDWFHYTGL